MAYTPNYPIAPVDLFYLDAAMMFISRRSRDLITLMEVSYNSFKTLYDNERSKYCISWKSKGTNGMDRNTLANSLSGDANLTIGAVHAMRKELVCLLTDLYLYVEFPITEHATTPAQAGTGLAGAVYPTTYVSTPNECSIRELCGYATQIRTFVNLLDDSYFSYRNNIRPYLNKYNVVIAPKTNDELNAIHAAACMSTSRTGLVHSNRVALVQYLVDTVELWSTGQW